MSCIWGLPPPAGVGGNIPIAYAFSSDGSDAEVSRGPGGKLELRMEYHGANRGSASIKRAELFRLKVLGFGFRV